MITVACVLRSGGIYTAEWVDRLAAGVRRHLAAPHHFVCLTDVPLALSGIAAVPLAAGARAGWWSKLELFRPDLFAGRVLYLDLDSVVVGDLAELAAYGGGFGMIGNFYRPQQSQSGLMAWNADGVAAGEIWNRWQADPAGTVRRHHGDGDFIGGVLGGQEDRLDRRYPGQIVSYKVNCLGARGATLRGTEGPPAIPTGARVVCFHGAPKPTDLTPDNPLVMAWRAA